MDPYISDMDSPFGFNRWVSLIMINDQTVSGDSFSETKSAMDDLELVQMGIFCERTQLTSRPCSSWPCFAKFGTRVLLANISRLVFWILDFKKIEFFMIF